MIRGGKTVMNIQFRLDQLPESLTVLAAGMISIFAVIGVIIVATIALNKIFSDDKKTDE